jgi:uncharacterized protein with HEPN domain
MDRQTRKLLRDALDAIDEILEYTEDVDLGQFMSDRKTQRATYYAFAVLGEAIGKLTPAYRARLTDYRPAIDMRNRLIHGYSTVDAGIVWAAVQQDIHNLRDELDGLLIDD